MSVEKRWKKGLCLNALDDRVILDLIEIKKYAEQCEEFILGVPDENTWRRIWNKAPEFDYNSMIEVIKGTPWITDIAYIDKNNADYQVLFDELAYDLCIMGSMFGSSYELVKQFLVKKGVEIVTNLSKSYIRYNGLHALKKAIESLPGGIKIVLFGTGMYFDAYMDAYGEEYRPEYAVDNSKDKWNTKKRGILIKSPDSLAQENPGNIMVVVCSKNPYGMLEQLLSYGAFDYRLMIYNNASAMLEEFGINFHNEDIIMKRIHDINYDMLKAVAELFDKRGIRYYMAYGSLIGTIRHGGPIPWDNDIDLLIPRKEYDRLLQFRNEFDDKIKLVTPEDIGRWRYYDSVPRILYKQGFVRLDADMCGYYHNLNNRFNIDLFLLDKTYGGLKGKLHRTHLALIYGLMNAYRHKGLFGHYNRRMHIQNAILRICGRMIPLPILRRRAYSVARRYENDSKAPYCFNSAGDPWTLNELYPVELFESTKKMLYQDCEIQAPVGAEEYLRLKYGNYMELPLPEQRMPHWGTLEITPKLFEFEEEPY